MITFEQARQIVAENRGKRFGEGSDFTVLEQGWETADRWIVAYSTEATDSRPWTSVDKETGEYFEDSRVGGEILFPDKTPVG